MKSNIILILLLSFLVNQILLSSDVSLEKYGRVSVSPSDNSIIFASSSFDANEVMYFKITATNFLDRYNYVKCQFGDNTNNWMPDFESIFTNTIQKRGKFTKFFKVEKSAKYMHTSSGNMLKITFYCSGGDVIIENTKDDESSSASTIDYRVDLKKYGKINVSGRDEYIVFDSSDFKEGDNIHFKITARDFIYKEIDYEFFDDLSNPNQYIHGPTDYVDQEMSLDKINTVTKYYSIKKDKKHLGDFEGKYMTLYFFCIGSVEIENTKEDEGKKIITIILIIIVCVVFIALMIGLICLIFYCKRIRDRPKVDPNNISLENTQNSTIQTEHNVIVGNNPNPNQNIVPNNNV